MRLHIAALAAAALLTATLGGCATAYDDGGFGYGYGSDYGYDSDYGYGYGSQGYSQFGYGYPSATRHYDSRIFLYPVVPHRGVVHGGRHYSDRDRVHRDWRQGDHRRGDRAWRDRDDERRRAERDRRHWDEQAHQRQRQWDRDRVRQRSSRDDEVRRGAPLDDGRATTPVRTTPERVERATRFEQASRQRSDRQRVREERRPVPEAAVVNPRNLRGARQAVQDDAPEDWRQIERPAGPRQQSQR